MSIALTANQRTRLRDRLDVPVATGALQSADAARQRINGSLDDTRARLGQFMTPASVAELVASLVRTQRSQVRLLDPGAGLGSLTAATVDRLLARARPPRHITATCFEIDARLCAGLANTLNECRRLCDARGVEFVGDIRCEDYIAARAGRSGVLFADDRDRYDLVVMNPPYRKINSASSERLWLRESGIETTNLYSAFMLLAARQLDDGGEFVSINPRSFCNGPYFRLFRREMLRLLDLRRVHVFESRTDAFHEDAVLQENVVVYGVRSDARQSRVEISTTLANGSITRRRVAADQFVLPNDAEAVIHLVGDTHGEEVARRMMMLPETLDSLGVSASTGRVVDFRVRQHLREEPESGTAPLVFSAHFQRGVIEWPNGQRRKPNAIAINEDTASLLVPSGYFVLTKRFSAKEERRRVVAALHDPTTIGAPAIGFDNKTNYLHSHGEGLSRKLARGLTVFLNSTLVDEYFRLFSGHTQVNAADLRRMPFPSMSAIEALSKVVDLGDQATIDSAVDAVLYSVA